MDFPSLGALARVAEAAETPYTPQPATSESVLRAWLHLANLQFSARRMTGLLAHFGGDPRAVLAATDAELAEAPGFLARHLVRLRDPAQVVTERQWEWVERHQARLVLRGEAAYPRLLNTIPDPPPLLFLRGTLEEKDNLCISIVGTRHPTPYGRATAERLSRELARQGLTIVSGGAMGIDAAAHRGALEGGGRTLAVLGCGLDVDYPRENRALFERILESGALLTEYPLGAQPEAWRFPQRNRIVSGLSLGVLVVEAPWQSGALITASCAGEHGRHVMAVPGNIDRPASAGTNDLLKDGAVLVTGMEDVLRALGLVSLPARPEHQRALALSQATETETEPAANPPREAVSRPKETGARATQASSVSSLSERQKKLLGCLTTTPRYLDALAQEAGLSVVEAGIEMTFLELSGLARHLPGNTYILSI